MINVDGQMSRLDMFSLLIKASTGEHLEINGVSYKDVKAFRLEPHTLPGTLMGGKCTMDLYSVRYTQH